MRAPRASLLLGISLLSAAALSYEVLLLRLLSIIQWHHFGFMVISLALLGYGASGTLLSLLRERLEARFSFVFSLCAALFGVSSVACFAAVQSLPFNPVELLWDWRQSAYLALMYTLLAIPFMAAATAVGLAFTVYGAGINRVYRADLLGAGAGALLVIALLLLLPPQRCLVVVAALGFVAATSTLLHSESGRRRWLVALLTVASAATLTLAAGPLLQLQVSPYKGLPQTLAVTGAKLMAERYSPYGMLSLVASPTVPLRIAPGLSITATSGIPDQLGIFTDADGPTAINRYGGDLAELAFLDQLTSALAYHLAAPRRVAILGAGGGSDILQALPYGPARIDAVELNPQLIDWLCRAQADYAGHLCDHPAVRLHAGDGRSFLARAPEPYDLINLSLLDSFAAAATGVQGLNESYLYTAEALTAFVQQLSPHGMVSITRWMQLPPKDTLKLVATARTALEAIGVDEPARHLALIRSWKTTTLIIGRAPLTAEHIGTLQRFCRERAFDVVYHPGPQPSATNRYTLLQDNAFADTVGALLGPQAAQTIADYPFDIRPASDDRPYFFHFFRWRSLPELLALRQMGGWLFLEWGYLVLLATLAQALLIGSALIVAPMLARRGSLRPQPLRWRALGYFSLLGLCFLFIEMAFIQKFILLFKHPVFAAAAVIGSFLVCAGLGSGSAQRFAALCARRGWRPLPVITGLIATLAIALLALLPAAYPVLAVWSDVAQLLAALALLAPLAFFMGMPFPLGLAALAQRGPTLVPWAWCVNGCASVVSAVLASLIAVEWGLSIVVLAACAGYLLAAQLMSAHTP